MARLFHLSTPGSLSVRDATVPAMLTDLILEPGRKVNIFLSEGPRDSMSERLNSLQPGNPVHQRVVIQAAGFDARLSGQPGGLVG